MRALKREATGNLLVYTSGIFNPGCFPRVYMSNSLQTATDVIHRRTRLTIIQKTCPQAVDQCLENQHTWEQTRFVREPDT